MNLGGILKIIQGWIKIKGATDGTKIGNVGDKLKTTAEITQTPGSVPSISNNIIYNDMNVSNGGVARDTFISTNWINIYNYSGSGIFLGFLVTLQNIWANDGWYIRLIIDSKEIFEFNGFHLYDVDKDVIYGFDNSIYVPALGISVYKNTFRWTSPKFPIVYTSNITIKVKKNNGDSKFLAGLTTLTKDT